MVNRQKGFSLVELMIGLGVGAVVSLALVDSTKLLSNSTKGQSTHANAAAISALISQNLRFQTSCAATFQNGGNNIPYNRAQAMTPRGMPIAMTVQGIRAGAAANGTQITGSDNSVTVGTAPVFNGATSDLRVYNLEIRRMAFIQLAESPPQRFGYVYVDFQVPNTSTVFGGNVIRRKILGGVVIDAAAATAPITNCYGNSPQTDVATICTNMGCTWSAPNCNCQKPEFSCGPGELFWGVDAQSGVPICKELGGGSCPPGQYISGLGLERVICSAVPDEVQIVPATDCAPGALSWTVSGNTCSANATATTDTNSITINDTTAPETGSANFTCNAGAWSAPAGATCVTAPSCQPDGANVGALYGTCVGNPSNIAEIRASCCSGTTYAVCDANSDKLYYCGNAPTPPVEPVACYMYSRTRWWDAFDCDSEARFRRSTYSACVAALEEPTDCNVTPDCSIVNPGDPLYHLCPP